MSTLFNLCRNKLTWLFSIWVYKETHFFISLIWVESICYNAFVNKNNYYSTEQYLSIMILCDLRHSIIGSHGRRNNIGTP